MKSGKGVTKIVVQNDVFLRRANIKKSDIIDISKLLTLCFNYDKSNSK